MAKYTHSRVQTIILNEIYITITKKRVKNINLSINRNGAVKVSAPIRCAMRDITTFLNKKESWIKKHINKIKTQPQLSLPSPQTGDICLYLGKAYLFKVYESHKKSRICLDGNQMTCFIKPTASEKDKQQLLAHWHRTQMKMLLPELIRKWKAVIGVEVKEWSIKAMTSRWGSCNIIKKRIWLNLYLIQKPLICLEYVLVHEMVHLLEASHNKRFYALMSQFMPDWKTYKHLLDESISTHVFPKLH
jgi:predicted metal-dependent hydrolase